MMYDVIIIGSGIGGLTAGTYLAKNGYKVKIFEKLNQSGGYVSTFKQKDYWFEGATHILHEFDDLNFKYDVVNKLGLNDLEFIYFNNCFEVFLHDHNKILKSYKIDSGKDTALKNFNKLIPNEKENIKKLFDISYNIARDCFKLVKLEAEHKKINIIDLIPALLFLIKNDKAILKKMGGLYYRYFIQYKDKSFSQLIDFIDNQELKLLASFVGYTCCGIKPSKLSAIIGAIVFYQLIIRKPTWIKGGTKSLVNALIANIISHKGEIIYNSEVKEIIIKNNKAIGVILNNGEKHFAQNIISNSNAYNTYKNLIKNEKYHNDLNLKLTNYNTSLSAFMVYLGLPFDLKKYGYNRTMNIFTKSNDLDIVEQEINRPDTFFITNYTLMDKSFSSSGKSSIVLVANAKFENWENLTESNYNKRKSNVQKQFINNAQKITGIPLKKAEVIMSATPRTLKYYTGNPYGGFIGAEHDVAQTCHRRFKHKTHIKNLYLAGHDTRTGGGVNSVINSGLIAGTHILRGW